jgi:hypothetical protein
MDIRSFLCYRGNWSSYLGNKNENLKNDYVDLSAAGRDMAVPEFAIHVRNSEPVKMCSGCERCF